MKTKKFEAIDLDSLENVAGGVSLSNSIRGMDAAGAGYFRIDEYDNGATSYWSDAQHGQTDLPFDYFGFGY